VDFGFDALSDGRRFRAFCVINDFTRECQATIVDNSISGKRVTRELDRIAARERDIPHVADHSHRDETMRAVRSVTGRKVTEIKADGPSEPSCHSSFKKVKWTADLRPLQNFASSTWAGKDRTEGQQTTLAASPRNQ